MTRRLSTVVDQARARARTLVSGVPGGLGRLPVFRPDEVTSPDGITDNTGAVQSAIDRANARGGGIVLLTIGIWLVRGLIMRSGVILMGESSTFAGTIIRLAAGSDTHVIRGGSRGGNEFIHWCSVLDLQVDGNRENNSAGDGIRLEKAGGLVTIDRVQSRNNAGNGLTVVDPVTIHLPNIWLTENDGNGLRIDQGQFGGQVYSDFLTVETNEGDGVLIRHSPGVAQHGIFKFGMIHFEHATPDQHPVAFNVDVNSQLWVEVDTIAIAGGATNHDDYIRIGQAGGLTPHYRFGLINQSGQYINTFNDRSRSLVIPFSTSPALRNVRSDDDLVQKTTYAPGSSSGVRWRDSSGAVRHQLFAFGTGGVSLQLKDILDGQEWWTLDADGSARFAGLGRGIAWEQPMAHVAPGTSPIGYQINRVLVGKVSWQPGTIADGGIASTTVTVTGAQEGHPVRVALGEPGQGLLQAGLILQGNVTAADTVTVTLMNHTGGQVTVGTSTLYVMVDDLAA